MSRYAVAHSFAPILNTPDFRKVFGGEDGRSLPLDDQGLLRPVELICFPGTRFEVNEEIGGILKVRTNEYAGESLYIDQRFVEFSKENPPERARVLPSREQLLERMLALCGSEYIWGGNQGAGIPELLRYYPPTGSIDPALENRWILKGVDCSGLLYQASDGFTPRNTSDLVNYGCPVLIEGKSAPEITKLLKPLDIIVWRGHMFLAFDSRTSIESRLGRGVYQEDLQTRLEELLTTRQPVNDWNSNSAINMRFVIRRIK